jgi:hypothetical protein
MQRALIRSTQAAAASERSIKSTWPASRIARADGLCPQRPNVADRQWWLARFTLKEIREMAAAIWPDSGTQSVPKPSQTPSAR